MQHVDCSGVQSTCAVVLDSLCGEEDGSLCMHRAFWGRRYGNLPGRVLGGTAQWGNSFALNKLAILH